MNLEIEKITERDRECVTEMMRTFYSSDAVFTNGSAEIFERDIDECLSESPFLNGYVFRADGCIAGYAMTAHSFSTEFGKRCVWIEDIYIKEEYRGQGIGTRFFSFLDEMHPTELLRLEVEEENTAALVLYGKCGFSELPYTEMKK